MPMKPREEERQEYYSYIWLVSKSRYVPGVGIVIRSLIKCSSTYVRYIFRVVLRRWFEYEYGPPPCMWLKKSECVVFFLLLRCIAWVGRGYQ